MKFPKALRAPEDDGKGSSGAAAPAKDDKTAASPTGDTASAAELAKLKADNDRLSKAEAERARKEKDKADAEAARRAKDEGKLEETLTAAQRDLAAAKADNEKLIKSAEARAEAQIAKLPKDQQDKLRKYKDRVAFDVWLEMVDEGAASLPGAPAPAAEQKKKLAPPPSGSPTKDRAVEEGYEPTERTQQILDKLGVSDEQLRRLKVDKDHDGNSWRFGKQMKPFIAEMERKGIVTLNRATANDRKPVLDK